ncbi:MAG TPA: carboxypeptidase regulatory-like domain-containing protein [Candidatus Didemnitutus sp.]|nr:carboxypeptidase regulatory-like domain-containing protein [Candidatus Didemnitutus sp.]
MRTTNGRHSRPVFLVRVTLAIVALACGIRAPAASATDFAIPPENAADALLAFSRQTGIDVLFSFDALKAASSPGLSGNFEPDVAIERLLAGTGFDARRNWRGKFVVAAAPAAGAIRGRIRPPSGRSATSIRVSIPALHRRTNVDDSGEFEFGDLPPGRYRLVAEADGCRTLEITEIHLHAGQNVVLTEQQLESADGLVRLDPFVVEAKSGPSVDGVGVGAARVAAGNLDLPRTENDPLPFRVFDRADILRSGEVNLNEYLQRELLDSDASKLPPERDGSVPTYVAGSTNLSLRGFGSDETVVLVNGRRLPEILTANGNVEPPDINLIPLGLVQKIEVLPVSASSLYTGNPVGGVINVILRKDVTDTEVTATYSNAFHGLNAPESSVSLQHGQSLLDGRGHLLLNATFTQIQPPTESQLGYLHGVVPSAGVPIYAATPNVRSDSGQPLFGPGTSSFTSVAPGAEGNGGLAAFAGREGVADMALFNPPGDMAASSVSADNPYGRRQNRAAYFGSLVADILPWLQLGLDGFYSTTVATRGFDVVSADLPIAATSPVNPFGEDVHVSLNEIAPVLGQDYSTSRIDSFAVVAGALLKFPADWRVAFDAQYASNITKYRGLAGVDLQRWTDLANAGVYNPFRDTQSVGPPPEFYNQVLEFYGSRNRFVTLGNYDTLDAALRVTNQSLRLPTGEGAVNFGADYRIVRLADFTDVLRYGDGTEVSAPTRYSGRTLKRYSFFGEVQAPLWPARKLPSLIKSIDGDLALRYVAAASANESNFAPTAALKVDFGGGWSFRGSVTTASRFPTPQLSHIVGTGGGGGLNLQQVYDPVRNENVNVQVVSPLNPSLHTEDAVTQTAGLIFQSGTNRRLRVSLDFVDTTKTNELYNPANDKGPQGFVDLENLFPDRVVRGPADATHAVGPITTVIVGDVNAASRHSQDWNLSVNYDWNEVLGGRLDLYARLLYFQRYDLQILPTSPMVDELGHPDGAVSSILRLRSNFGAGWSNRRFGFGLDGRYYHARELPLVEQPRQGSSEIAPYWEFDAYMQSDLTRFLPGHPTHFGLRGQLRVDNLFAPGFPRYAIDPAGVEPYGDWRGRTYSLSVTASF